jgi:hypothetical protein
MKLIDREGLRNSSGDLAVSSCGFADPRMRYLKRSGRTKPELNLSPGESGQPRISRRRKDLTCLRSPYSNVPSETNEAL